MLLSLLFLSLAGCALAAAPLTPVPLPVLAWHPSSDWVNVKNLGAVGDGVADDTKALQTAFDGVKDGSTVYFPPGTYRITDTLNLKCLPQVGTMGALIVGCGRDTRIVWDGPEGGRMVVADGVLECRYVGMILDGRGKAADCLVHKNSFRFTTEVSHENMAFLNCTDTGLLIDPTRQQATAETLVENCYFENCKRGSAILQFNDYDWTYEGCEFRGCGTGIECEHGNTYIRDCHFEKSATVDMNLHPEHACSVRRCTSVGSGAFLNFSNGVSPVTVEDCRIEGWTNQNGAVALQGAPAMIFDCVFTNPPSVNPPITSQGSYSAGGERLIVSQNVSAATKGVYNLGQRATLYEIPAGKRKGSLTSAQQSFLRRTWPVPSVVLDAQRYFGAKGDGKTDDTAALQALIDAARAKGHGALAYLPAGTYVVKNTLHLTGADYYFGGSGVQSELSWGGPPGGTVISVEDPQHVALQNIALGNPNTGQDIDLLQTSAGRPSFMTYENVYVYGMYQNKPFVRGLWLRGLGAGATVLIRHVQGNIHLVDSAAATILADLSYEGSVVVEGKGKQRDGLFGVLSRLGTSATYPLIVRDDQNFVASDFYIEQTPNGFSLQGAPDDPPGRVTFQGATLTMTTFSIKGGAYDVANIDNYSGQVFFGPEQFYVQPPWYNLEHQGDRPLDFYLLAPDFYSQHLTVKQGAGLHLYIIGGELVGTDPTGWMPSDPANVTDLLPNLTPALDDLRRLGEVDLRLLHPTG
jgi:hypothetical protein